MQLLDHATGNVQATVTSDLFGNFLFPQLGPGTYDLHLVLKPGFEETTGEPANIAGISGITVDTSPIGVFRLAAVSGKVFGDVNDDRILNPGEVGVPGWTVDLINAASGTIQQSFVTNSTGQYTFDSLGPGTYRVRLEQMPPRFVQTTSDPADFTLNSGRSLTNVDFGVYETPTIGGQVFEDHNGNGTQDAADGGVAGFTVFVDVNDNGRLDTGEPQAVSDNAGNFTLTNMPPGTYRIYELTPNLSWIQTTPNPAPQTVTGGSHLSGITFGNFQFGSISGRVFIDNNADGIEDGSDGGVDGWQVTLINTATHATQQLTTSNGGNYTFTNLGPGTYSITETPATGFLQTNPNPAPVVVSSGANVSGLSFGNFKAASLTGHVFRDLNQDGVENGADFGQAGITIQATNSTGSVIGSATTDASGNFLLYLGLGTFNLQAQIASPTILSAASQTTVTVTGSGQIFSGTQFGLFDLGSISGSVFNDLAGDHTLNGADAGTAGWSIVLSNADTNATVATQTSDANGNFSFTGLPYGNYRIREVAQTGFLQTTANPSDVTTTSGTNVAGISFGNFQLFGISGNVFVDQNGNGRNDRSDTGRPSIPVSLLDPANPATPLQQTTTDANGNYGFANLGPGSYQVRIGLPTGSIQTTANPATIVASSGQNVTGVNFGTFQTFTVSGRVFQDINADGTSNGGTDPGFPGFTIHLYFASSSGSVLTSGRLLSTKVTDANGQFAFNNLGPGSYIVQEVRKPGLLPTTPLTSSVAGLSGVDVTSITFGDISSANRSFVYQVYLDLLHRHVDLAGLNFWSGRLDQGSSRSQVVHDIQNSTEYRTNQIQALYRQLLGRDADQAGLKLFLNLMMNTPYVLGSDDPFLELRANILGSAEYFARHGGTNESFLRAIYHDVLGRDIDAFGLSAWESALSHGSSRILVAKQILYSAEAQSLLVQGLYNQYLHRPADDPSLNAFVGALRGGLLQDQVVNDLIASTEYYNRL